MIDRKTFFDIVRHSLFKGSLDAEQVDGMTRILDEWERRKLSDLRWLAQMLTVTKWETAHTMQPIREQGGEKYLRSKPYYPWVGEGLVQVTWEDNHRKFGATKPGQLMTWPMCLGPLFEGMIGGMFTTHKLNGKMVRCKLADFFNDTTDNAREARKIINPKDWKSYDPMFEMHKLFLTALKAAALAAATPSAAPPPIPDMLTPPPPQPTAAPPRGLLAALIAILMAIFGKKGK